MATGDIPSFIFGGNTGIPTYDDLQRRRAISYAIAARARAAPKTLGEGLTYVGEAVGDRMAENRLAEEEKAFRGTAATDPLLRPMTGGAKTSDATDPAGARDRIAALYAGGPGGAAGNPTVAAGASSPQASTPQAGGQPDDSAVWSARADAIGGIETGGTRDPYRTVGVPTKYGPALGRYGVVAANVPAWTQAALGQSMTPEQFLADPKAQDAVFQHRFGDYVNRYGEEGAARAWYGGAGQNNLNATDALGRLTVKGYGQDYLNRLQGQRRGAPTSALETGTTSDAPPVTGLPVGDENPPTPTDIKPMPIRVAEAAGAVPTSGTVAAAPAAAARPAVPAAVPPATLAPRYARPPLPEPAPITPEEVRAAAIRQKYPGYPAAEVIAKQLSDYGASQRAAINTRNAEVYRADLARIEAQEARDEQRKFDEPKRALELQQAQGQVLAQEAAQREEARKLSQRGTYGDIPAPIASHLEESKKAATTAVASLESMNNAKMAMEAGTIFGLGAQAKLLGYQAMAAAGNKEAARIVAATETYKTSLGPTAQAAIKAYGGTQISNEDRRFGLSMSGADISQNEGSARRMIDIAERSAKAKLAEHRDALDTMLKDQPPILRKIYDVPDPLPGMPVPGAAPKTAATPVAAPTVKDGDTATGPGGAKMIRRGGKWEPM